MKHVVMAAAVMASGLAAAPALADQNNGFGVATAARARDSYSYVPFVSAYRTTGDSSGNYTRPADVPSVSMQGGCDGLPTQYCSGGAAGTGGSNYNLTASNSSAFRADTWAAGTDPLSTGSAAARANLATGEVGVEAASTIWRDYRGAATHNVGDAFAQFNDLLNFTVVGAGPGTVTNITVSLLIEGVLGISDLRGGAGVSQNFYFGNASVQYARYIGGGYAEAYGFETDRGWVSSAWDFSTPGAAKFTGVYALTGAAQELGVYSALYAYAGGTGSANFFNTSKLSLSLPGGTSFGSASGTFLSAQANTVPEPASWAMLLTGFGLVGAMLRRRTRAAVVAA